MNENVVILWQIVLPENGIIKLDCCVDQTVSSRWRMEVTGSPPARGWQRGGAGIIIRKAIHPLVRHCEEAHRADAAIQSKTSIHNIRHYSLFPIIISASHLSFPRRRELRLWYPLPRPSLREGSLDPTWQSSQKHQYITQINNTCKTNRNIKLDCHTPVS